MPLSRAEDKNVSFVPFAQESRLDARLSAADIHIVTLRSEWTGSVVPSKFFGALAAGRPVLFIGSGQSSLATWIKTHRVGWVLEPGNQSQIVTELCRLSERTEELPQLFEHCHRVYQEHFSRAHVIDRLEGEMREMITVPKPALDGAPAGEAA